MKKTLYYSLFFLAFLWGANNFKEASERLGLESFNQAVKVRVINLPSCGRSNIIEVEYQGEVYSMSISKNDCIQSKYDIGDIVDATFNSKLREVNPVNFVGVYRLNVVYMAVLLVLFVGFVFIQRWKTKRV